MDKSFEGLLFSVILHVALIALLLTAHFKPYTPLRDTTEITIIEKPASDERKKNFVTETNKKDVFEDLKDTADFLSQFTKRVKKQMRAAQNGPTQNAVPQPNPQNRQKTPRERIGGMEKDPSEGIGNPRGGIQNPMRNVAIGQSSISEHIPGIEEGAFTSLNTDQFTYYTFFARMNEQVRNRWISNVRSYMARLTAQDLEKLSKMERQTVVEIILSPDGTFNSSVIHNSSGDRELDQTTVRAFRDAAPFLNPPQGMVESDGMIHLRYGFVVHFRPPSFGPAG